MPTSTFDVNAAYAPIAARLAQVDGVKAVRGVNDLTQILRGQTTGTDGYVYLYLPRRTTTATECRARSAN